MLALIVGIQPEVKWEVQWVGGRGCLSGVWAGEGISGTGGL